MLKKGKRKRKRESERERKKLNKKRVLSDAIPVLLKSFPLSLSESGFKAKRLPFEHL